MMLPSSSSLLSSRVITISLFLCVSLLFVSPCTSSSSSSSFSSPAVPAPRYRIPLSSPPLTRWQPIITDHLTPLANVLDWIHTHILPPNIDTLLEPIMSQLDNILPAPYADEMRGIVTA